MKRKTFVPAVVIAALAVAVYYRYTPGRTPAGQPALANLNPASFQQQFQAAAGHARLLALFSPT